MDLKIDNLQIFKTWKKEIDNELKNIKVYEIIESDDYTNAKLDLKQLTDLEAKVNRVRIDFKTDFDKAVKDMLEPLVLKINDFKENIKSYDDKEKVDKLTLIEKHFETLKSPVELDRLFDNRYFNKTYKLYDIENDLTNKVEKINADIGIIKMLDTNVRLLELYIQELDITRAKELFDLETNNTVEIEEVENNLNKYSLTFKTDKDTFDKITRFISALGIDLDELY